MEISSELEKNIQRIKRETDLDWPYPPEELANLEGQNILSVIKDVVLKTTNVFVASFCAHDDNFTQKNGLLSQWRGYGQSGGVCIVLDYQKLKELIEKEYNKHNYTIILEEFVKYKRYEYCFKKEIKNISDSAPNFINVALKDVPSFKPLEEKIDIGETYKPFMTIMAFSKHQGFEEEKEFRICFAAASITSDKESRPNKEVHFRSTEYLAVPYIKAFEGEEFDLPIVRVIVGPGIEQERRFNSIRNLIIENKKPIEVIKSEIPFL